MHQQTCLGRLQLEHRQTVVSLSNINRASSKSREVVLVPQISRSSSNNTQFSVSSWASLLLDSLDYF